jgi:hypothetical protein
MTLTDITGLWWSDDGENTTVTCNTNIETGKTYKSIDENGVETTMKVYEQYSATVPSTEIDGLDDPTDILKQAIVDQNK